MANPSVYIDDVDVTEHIQLDSLVEGETYYPIVYLQFDEIGRLLLRDKPIVLTLVYPQVTKRNPITRVRVECVNPTFWDGRMSAAVAEKTVTLDYEAGSRSVYTDLNGTEWQDVR